MHKNTLMKLFLLVMILFLCLTLVSSPVFGGDWIDHGGDWGGSNNDWGSGNDSSSDWDDPGSFGFLPFGGSGDGSGGEIFGFVVFLIIVFVIIAIARSKKNGGNSGSNYSTTPLQMSDTSSVNPSSLAKLKAEDANFSEAAMLSKAENMFTTMQIAWCKQDYEPVRPFLSNALFEQQQKQLKDKISRDEKNVSSEIAVLQSKLESYSTDGHIDYLNVWMRVKMKDYVVKISDPSKIVSGTPNRMYHLDFRWQFSRSAGSTTNAATDAVKTGECPSCGANININQSGKCEFCGSVISTTEYDWVLSKIDALQQRSR